MRRCRGAGVAALLALAGHALLAASVPVTATVGSAPPLPPPASPAAHCVSFPLSQGSWVEVTDQAVAGTTAYQVVVDPWIPCLAYRVRNPQTVERSTDGGHTWTVVLHDAATAPPASQDPTCGAISICPASSGPFAMSSISVPAPGTVAVSEWGNGDAVVLSGDAGWHWRLADTGIEGLHIGTLRFTSNGATAYATVAPPTLSVAETSVLQGTDPAPALADSHLLAVTTDSARTWSLRQLPCSTYETDTHDGGLRWLDPVAIDPGDGAHIWCVQRVGQAVTIDGLTNPETAMLWESTDHGSSWRQVQHLAGDVTQLLPIRWAHGLRLLLGGWFDNPATSVLLSDDGGATWQTSALPPGEDAAITDVPGRPGHVVVALSPGAGPVSIYASDDALDHHTALLVPAAAASSLAGLEVAVDSPLTPRQGVGNWSASPAAALQAARSGDLYLAVRGCTTTCPYRAQAAVTEYWRLRPGTGGPSAARPEAPPPQGPGVVLTPWPAACARVTGDGDRSGTVAYDGRELVLGTFTRTGPLPDIGLLRRVDPVTCAALPDLLIHFDPRELAAAGFSDAPVVQGVVYDTRRNALWVALQEGGSYALVEPLFLVDRFDREAGVAWAHLTPDRGCIARLTYDPLDDSLWTCSPSDWTWGKIRAADGVPLDTCMSVLSEADPTGVIPGGADSWMVMGPQRMLVESEDDTSVYTMDDRACTVLSSARHATVAEGIEDNTMACDTLTAGAGSPPLVWLRDGNAYESVPQLAGYVMRAFVMPGAVCPLPTRTLVPDLEAARGQSLQVCALLDHIFPGGAEPVSGLQVQVELSGPDGRAIDLGGADAAQGRVCVPWTAGIPGATYRVHAVFAGTDRFFPSAGDGLIRVLPVAGAISPALPPRVGLAAPVDVPAPPGVPVPNPGVASGAAPAAPATAAEVQGQAQAQSQATAQAQVGMVAQRRTQPQVATEMLRPQNRAAQPVLLAVRARQASAAALLLDATVVAALTLLRRRVAPARRRR